MDTNSVIEGIKWAILKISSVIFWIAEAVQKYLLKNFEAVNIYYVLLALGSLYLASKIIPYRIGEDRGWKLLAVAVALFSIIYYFGGHRTI